MGLGLGRAIYYGKLSLLLFFFKLASLPARFAWVEQAWRAAAALGAVGPQDASPARCSDNAPACPWLGAPSRSCGGLGSYQSKARAS
jgi:hypothetical protein